MKQAIFLDRDGVINEVLSSKVKFVNQPSDFHLLPGVGEAIRTLNEEGFLVFVVTNQGGIGLGYMQERMLERVHEKMQQDLVAFDSWVDDVAYCPHKPKAGCRCRKPQAYMLQELATRHEVDLQASVMVGDREPDILAGQAAGCQTVLIHKGTKRRFGADAIFPDLRAALPWILKQIRKAEAGRSKERILET
ncbi:D-glycero-alpha-D-manno-heptose-1,7-bisphosphate 7-phosphatase [Shouchella shacheensis]|uniref:D-glycero-alpha-D-manno-heptose-1,7-bisphosphate 7-phosphatase n=1 Tax=Shouchella shacheensis TaxID=1649580 RepID=UPI0007405017|nr:HAD family hydrolase [Shouchella shacheensis]